MQPSAAHSRISGMAFEPGSNQAQRSHFVEAYGRVLPDLDDAQLTAVENEAREVEMATLRKAAKEQSMCAFEEMEDDNKPGCVSMSQFEELEHAVHPAKSGSQFEDIVRGDQARMDPEQTGMLKRSVWEKAVDDNLENCSADELAQIASAGKALRDAQLKRNSLLAQLLRTFDNIDDDHDHKIGQEPYTGAFEGVNAALHPLLPPQQAHTKALGMVDPTFSGIMTRPKFKEAYAEMLKALPPSQLGAALEAARRSEASVMRAAAAAQLLRAYDSMDESRTGNIPMTRLDELAGTHTNT